MPTDRDEKAYRESLKLMSFLMELDPAPEDPYAYDLIQKIGSLIVDYEEEHYPLIDTTTPKDSLEFHTYRLGLSLEEVAHKTNVPVGQLEKVLEQDVPLEHEAAEALASLFSVPVSDFLPK
jgi:antitoxin component HigA of HigAB toxin-antitoxin module